MKFLLLLLFIKTLVSYNPDAATQYAHDHCDSDSYNPAYPKYDGHDCANFVSQCLIAGGLNLNGCVGVNSYGTVPAVSDLKSCLSALGWKSSSSRPQGFRDGYPMIYDSHAVLATYVDGSTIKYSAHTNDRCDSGFYGSPVFYYL